MNKKQSIEYIDMPKKISQKVSILHDQIRTLRTLVTQIYAVLIECAIK